MREREREREKEKLEMGRMESASPRGFSLRPPPPPPPPPQNMDYLQFLNDLKVEVL